MKFFPGTRLIPWLLGSCWIVPAMVFGQESHPAAVDRPYVVEYYYKARWGYADEFIRLFKKNHYPILKKEMAANRGSIFLAEEKQVALNLPSWTPVYPDSPHEHC